MLENNNYNYPVHFSQLIKDFTDEQKSLLENPVFLEAAYRIKELQYTIEDVKNCIEDLYEDELDDNPVLQAMEEDDYALIAIDYLENHDCNESDNGQMEYYVKKYVKQKESEM